MKWIDKIGIIENRHVQRDACFAQYSRAKQVFNVFASYCILAPYIAGINCGMAHGTIASISSGANGMGRENDNFFSRIIRIQSCVRTTLDTTTTTNMML